VVLNSGDGGCIYSIKVRRGMGVFVGEVLRPKLDCCPSLSGPVLQIVGTLTSKVIAVAIASRLVTVGWSDGSVERHAEELPVGFIPEQLFVGGLA
jgi:hypothetical protein